MALISAGRILLVIIFIFSGVSKLLDIAATAQMIGSKIAIPTLLAPYATQLEAATAMTTPQLLAIIIGVVEIVGGLMIAFNLGARWFAALLILFTFGTTFLYHDFWNMSGPERLDNMIHALKNLSIIGGLLIVVGLGPPLRDVREPQFDEN